MRPVSILALLAPFALAGCLFVSESKTVIPAEPQKAAAAPAAASARITAGMPDANPAITTTTAGLTITHDVVYGHHDGMALVYDVIKPKNANGSAVLYMVSGGWVSRSVSARIMMN